MDSAEIVTRLVQGSHNIDRMRTEIEQVVCMVMGLIPLSRHGLSETVETESCRWIVVVTNNRKKVECWRLTGFGTLVYDSARQVPLYGHYVEFVYRNLHGFIEAALKLCPILEEAWGPIMSASRVQFAS